MSKELISTVWTAFPSVLGTFAGATVGYLAIVHYKFIGILIRTLRRDLTGLIRVIKSLSRLIVAQLRNRTVGDAFNQTVAKYPNKICFYFEDQRWSFKDVHELSNKIGNYFSAQGFRKGDVIGIFMENCPQYAACWLGLSKIGVVSALVNTNLRMESLKHSLDIVKCKAVIYSEELSDATQELVTSGLLSTPIFSYSKTEDVAIPEAVKLSSALASASTEEPVSSERVNFTDPLFYIYTSGTTGLPKAATFKHARYFMAGTGGHYLHDVRADDVLYMCLPLYHSAGGVLGLGQVFLFGTTMALRKKFSASAFWSDCISYNVTVVQYIGEICRYLLTQPESSLDRKHSVRLMYGNGLRKEIWTQFVQRFGIQHIAELYGSTEGNTNLTNFDGTVGAVGFIPRWMYPLLHFKIVKVNERTGEIVRDSKTGLGVICKPNEPGEFVGTIVKNHIYKDFQGYAGSNTKTESKIARNVLKSGDLVFRSGDQMIMDELGYFYFKDRCGDTFRWKGENVSTTEVESVITSITKLSDCVVYGVQIPGTEGRAGMVAIVDDSTTLELESLASGVKSKLPMYARPLFLRMTKHIERTGTFKLKKLDMQNDGFDINKISDPIYFYQGGQYVRLEKPLYSQIISGEVRL